MASEETNELKGVQGWLLFLVVALTILGPARGAWKVYARWRDLTVSAPEYMASGEGQLLQTIDWTAFAIGVIISICTGILLLRRHRPDTVKITIFNLWLIGPVISLTGYLIALAMIGDTIHFEDLKFMLLPTASAILWTLYLLNSQRVRNTYGFNGLFARQPIGNDLA